MMEPFKYYLFIIFVILTVICEIKCQRKSLMIPPANDTIFWRQYIDPRASAYQITSNYIDSCSQRQAPGFVCMSDCSTLARCVFRNNGWETIPLQLCDTQQGLFCNANEQACSRNPGPCNPGNGQGGGSFSCTSEGVFPDPHSCQTYHMCFLSYPNLINLNIRCGGNFAFNPITNDCSLDMNHQVCRGNQFNCNRVGDMGPWPLNPNIYYICMAQSDTIGGNLILFPQIYRCPIHEVFRGGNCVRNDGSFPPGIVPPPGGPGFPPGGSFQCTRAGLFPDQFDCRSYYHCDGLMRARHLTCPTGTYFNRMTLGCIRGNC